MINIAQTIEFKTCDCYTERLYDSIIKDISTQYYIITINYALVHVHEEAVP